MTRNFDVALSFHSLRMPTPFPRHYRARFHGVDLFSLFPVSVSTPFFPFPTRFPNPQVGMVFPRLSTRHLFAGAIWKFNACALTRKITAIPTPTHRARSKLSLTFPDLSAYTYRQNTRTLATHSPLFRQRKTLTGHYPRAPLTRGPCYPTL